MTAPEDDDLDLCVGICMADEDTGYCLGCGRLLREVAPLPAAVPEASSRVDGGAQPTSIAPESPQAKR